MEAMISHSGGDAPRDREAARVVLLDPQDRVLMMRYDNGPPNGSHWATPGGGLEPGESYRRAARRELAEETGARRARFLKCTTDWVAYDFPPGHGGSKAQRGWKGQKQVWYAFRFEGDDAEFDLTAHGPPEFDAWRWAYLEEAAELIVPFKREAYRRVVQAFGDLAARPQAGSSGRTEPA
jgi:putative (di)nucleoside polyphosphate hydrolase